MEIRYSLEEVLFVHPYFLAQEINPALAVVQPVNGTLRVWLPKKNHAPSR
jgi:hypothetical protein